VFRGRRDDMGTACSDLLAVTRRRAGRSDRGDLGVSGIEGQGVHRLGRKISEELQSATFQANSRLGEF